MRGEDEPEIIARKAGGIWISSLSSRNVNHGLGRNRICSPGGKDVVGPSKNKVSSFKSTSLASNGEFNDRRRLSKRKISQIDFKPRVDRDIGNADEFMDLSSVEIERIDEAEFRNKRTHSMPSSQPGKYQTLPGNTLQVQSKEISSAPDHSSRPYKSTSFVEKGVNDIDMDLQDIEIERITKAEFMKKKSSSVSKMRTSARQKSKEGYPEATPKKTTKWMEKKIFCSGLSGSILPVNAYNDSNLWLQDRSSSFVKKGNGHKVMIPYGVEIVEIAETEFQAEKPYGKSKIDPSNKQEIKKGHVATPWKNVDVVRKNISCSALCGSFSLKDANRYSDQGQQNKWSPYIEKGNDKEDTDPEKDDIEIIDEAEFRNKKTDSAPNIAPSTRQKQRERYSREKIKFVNKRISNFRSGSLSCWDVSVDSNGDPDKTSSLMKEGNVDENVDFEKVEIEKIDESEFKNKKPHSVPMGAPTTRQKPNKRYSAAASWKKVKCVSEKKSNFHFRSLSPEDVSFDSNGDPHKSISFVKKENCLTNTTAMANEDEEIEFETKSKNTIKMEDDDQKLDKNLLDDVNYYCHEWINSNSSIQCNRKLNPSSDDAGFLEVEKICSSGSEHDNKLDMANRIRPKTRIVKKFPDVNKYSCSRDIFESMNDEDFRVDNPSFCDSWEPQYHDVQEIESVKVSATKCSDCSKQERTTEQECSFRKKQLSIFASIKRNEEGTSYKPNKVLEENYEKKADICDDLDEEGVFKNKSDGIQEKLQKHPNLERLYSEKYGDEAGAIGSKDHSKVDDNGPIDFGVQIECSQAISGFHVHDKNELSLADETKHLRKRKQVSSKQYNSWKLLADSVMERGLIPEDRESDDRAKQAPAPKAQNNQSLKVRLVDDLPKAVEKTEYGKEIEGLVAEVDFSCALVQMGSVNIPKVHNVDDTNGHDEETQHARCARGDHEFLQDDMRLTCMRSPHVELGPRDVEKNCKLPGRTRSSEMGQLPEFDQLNLISSANDFRHFDNNRNGTVWDVKPGIKESMYKHQQEGFEFLWKNLAGSINLTELRSCDPSGEGGCIISHAPGTGKTRLTIVFIETYLKLFPSCRPVIIAPASMLLTWEEEFKKWNVEFPFYNLNNPEVMGKENNTALRRLSGPSSQYKELIRMVKIYSWDKGGSILGISYSLYEKLAGEKYNEGEKKQKNNRVTVDNKCEALRKILIEKSDLVVLDEGHTPRNEKSNIWNALLKLHTKKRVILSGTLFQNNFAELFNTLRLVRPAFADVLSQEKIFAAEMMTSRKTSRRKHGGRNAQSTSLSKAINSAVERLKLAMSPFVHVHKGIVLQQSLPGLSDCVVLLKPPALQKSLIDRIEGLQSTLELEHKVALISVHPYLLHFCGSVEKQWLGIDMGAIEASKLKPNEGGKTKFIFELVRLSLAMNEKVLIFSQYIQPLELIKDQLKETFMWVDGKQIFQMQGKLDQKQRQLMINIFNDPQSEAKVMLASTKCCSEGISLIGASRLVLLDVVWNPSVAQQAISRAYRIGQKKYVYTYRLMTSGTTEGEKYCRQAEKERLSELVFTSSSNEGEKYKHPAAGIKDGILEEMVAHENLNAMFEKIINHPKETDLSRTLCLTS